MTARGPRETSGKRLLVTGGTKGAGKAIADRFLQGGATVVITARSAPTEETPAHYIQADVSTSQGTSKVIREILDRFKGVDIVVRNVGGSTAPSGGFISVTDENVAAGHRRKPLSRRPAGSRPASLDDRARLRCHRAYFVHPADPALL